MCWKNHCALMLLDIRYSFPISRKTLPAYSSPISAIFLALGVTKIGFRCNSDCIHLPLIGVYVDLSHILVIFWV